MLAWHFAGLSPASVSPATSPTKRTEPAMLEAKAANPVVSTLYGYAPLRSRSRCRGAWWCDLLAIICLYCLPRLKSFGKTGTNFGGGGGIQHLHLCSICVPQDFAVLMLGSGT